LGFRGLFDEVLGEALIEREGDRSTGLQAHSHDILPFSRENFHGSFYPSEDIGKDEGGREGGLGDFDCEAVSVVPVEVGALLRGDDAFADCGHGGGVGGEEATDFEGDGVFLFGEEGLAERLAQEGEDAVVDEEEVKGCFWGGRRKEGGW